MKGSCPECLKMQISIADFCCVLCALGLSAIDPCVTKDSNGTTVIDLRGMR